MRYKNTIFKPLYFFFPFVKFSVSKRGKTISLLFESIFETHLRDAFNSHS
jgi:hypothetical protein